MRRQANLVLRWKSLGTGRGMVGWVRFPTPRVSLLSAKVEFDVLPR